MSLGTEPIQDSVDPDSEAETPANAKTAQQRSFKRAGLSFFVAAVALNVSNFVFHVVIGRMIGPARYGEAMALLNVLLVLGVFFAALQATITQAVVDAEAAGRDFDLRGLLNRAGLAGIAIGAAVAALSPRLTGFLHMPSVRPVLVLALMPVLALLAAVLQGVLMARVRYATVGAASLIGGGAGRMIAGVALVAAGGDVTAVVAASVVGQMISTGWMLAAVAPELRRRCSSRKPHSLGLDGALSTAALAGYWILASMDLFLVRHLMAPKPAGIYAAAATAGRIAMFAPSIVVQIAFPLFARRRDAPGRDLAISLGLVGAVGIGAAVVIVTVPRLLVGTLFGSAFSVPAETVSILGFEGAVLALVTLLVYFHISRRSYWSLSAWAGVALGIASLWLFHGSTEQTAWAMLASASATLVLAVIPAVPVLRKETRESFALGRSRPAMAAMGPAELDLTLVVPFYNPGPRFGDHLSGLISVLDAAGLSYEVIAVSDGSTDGSVDSVHQMGAAVLRCVELPRNAGKGMALRAGLAKGRGAYLGFIDADGDIPPETLGYFLTHLQDRKPDIVTGSKRHRDSAVVYPPLRRLYSWGYQQLLRALFRLEIQDTQTGIKLVRREVLVDVLPLMLQKRFAFDLELFVLAKLRGYKRFEELPVTILERYSSTVSIKSVRQMLQDTLAIFYRLRILKYYQRQIVRQRAQVTVPAETPSIVTRLQDRV